MIWSATLVAGFQVGFLLPVEHLPACAWPSPENVLRLAVGLALLTALPRVPAPAVWWLALTLAVWSGHGFQVRLRDSVYRRADPPWAYLERVLWEGPATLRVTGWSVPRNEGRVRFPAVLLGVGRGSKSGCCPDPRTGQTVLVSAAGVRPEPGQVIVGTVRLRPPGRASLPGGFSDARYLAGKGISWRGTPGRSGAGDWRLADAPRSYRWLADLHGKLLHKIDDIWPPPEAALVAAVLLGTKSPLAADGARPFTRLGLAHLFALSGLHVGILLGMVLLLSAAGGGSSTARLVPVLLLLPVYVFLTGAPGSVVRAASMAVLGLMPGVLGRRGDALRLLGLVFLLVIMWGPWQMLDTGIRLSFLAAGGILAVGRVTGQYKLEAVFPVPLVVAGLGVSLSAQWFTLPEIAGGFGHLNAWSPLMNLLVVPLFGLVVWLSVTALLGSWWPWFSQSLAALSILGWRGLLMLCGPLAGKTSGAVLGMMPPDLETWGLWLAGTAALLVTLGGLRKGSLRWRMGLPIMVMVPLLTVMQFHRGGRYLSPRRGPVAWQVDVGQGDCACLAFPDRWRCVIDTGGRLGAGGRGQAVWDRTLGPYLHREGIHTLDLVVLTHGHLDHTGGKEALAREFKVQRWLCGGQARPPVAGAITGSPGPPRVLHRWREWSLILLQAPDSGDDSLSENNHSLMLGLVHGDRTVMVWGGDQERAAERIFLAAHRRFGPVRVWKAGHHGSDTSGSADFIAALRPDLCLISCGAGNRYRHPSHGPYAAGGDTLATVRTDCAGSILLQWGSDGGLNWSTMYGPAGALSAP